MNTNIGNRSGFEGMAAIVIKPLYPVRMLTGNMQNPSDRVACVAALYMRVYAYS